jgi:ectoine hydroxylase-related dioxygenase (phytanoyl-CoA dioxygenase family)
LQLWPGVADVWRRAPLPDLLADVLGLNFGLVRVLYFDKPPEQSWALPWHKDMTIAVKDNRLPSAHFSHPTTKIGVPHVEVPEWLLEQMLTLRLHLDDMTEENGPLKVMAGSHRGEENKLPTSIFGQRGDVLLMRPLVSHCSNRSKEGTTQHRRILHFEFAGVAELPDGYEWHDYVVTGR